MDSGQWTFGHFDLPVQLWSGLLPIEVAPTAPMLVSQGLGQNMALLPETLTSLRVHLLQVLSMLPISP